MLLYNDNTEKPVKTESLWIGKKFRFKQVSILLSIFIWYYFHWDHIIDMFHFYKFYCNMILKIELGDYSVGQS